MKLFPDNGIADVPVVPVVLVVLVVPVMVKSVISYTKNLISFNESNEIINEIKSLGCEYNEGLKLVSDLFEATLSQLAVLAILNTIVPSMGGVAGNQTLTLVIRGMALGHVNEGNSKWLISKELAIGFFNGAIWAILIASVIALWKQDWMLGAVIAFAMMINMIAAGLAGATLPLIMKKLKIDPALAGSVILTTITDVVGIFAFLGTATLFLI